MIAETSAALVATRPPRDRNAPAPILLDTPVPFDPLLGTRVGNFILERRLGHGGMGAVYLGENRAIGSKVAVKFLHAGLAQDPTAVRRFYDEARAANVVSHENIVRVLDLGHDPERGFHLIMEYVPGRTLGEILAEGPVSLAFAEEILAQLCSALGDAHARGVVHRDLKPENILVVERGSGPQVKIADFGIAKLRADTAAGCTALGEVMGTPAFMSPEQCQGLPADARADIYSLGVMTYQMCTGRLPFEGGVARLLVAQVHDTPRPPRELRPDLPANWNAAILRALAKRPDDRFAEVSGFLAAIRAKEVQPVVEVTLAPGLPPIPLRASRLSRGGALLGFAGVPPPLWTRIAVALDGEDGRVQLEAEVVRHVGEAEARAWSVEPGFAVQFHATPSRFSTSMPALKQVATDSSLEPRQRERLEHYASRLGASHYALLELREDASQQEIVARGQAAVAELRELERLQLSSTEQAQLRAGLARVAGAIAALANPVSRLRYDGASGNHRGAAVALRAVDPLIAEREHAAFLAARPDVDARVGVHLARVRLARACGNLDAARGELEAALKLDAMDPGLHRMRVELLG